MIGITEPRERDTPFKLRYAMTACGVVPVSPPAADHQRPGTG